MDMLQTILGHVRRADTDFSLIDDGDRIAVGLSGGKDSLTLCAVLAKYRDIGLKKFELMAISVDCTDGKTDFSRVTKFCDDLGIKHHVESSQIFKVIFDERKEKSPCSLCAKMRRGVLNGTAVRLGCNKVALGHHGDDLLETFLLCLMYEGRISTFAPKTYLDRTDITVLRPLVYASERETIACSRTYPILNNCCPVNGKTQREYMKNLVKTIGKDIKSVRERMLDAIIKKQIWEKQD